MSWWIPVAAGVVVLAGLVFIVASALRKEKDVSADYARRLGLVSQGSTMRGLVHGFEVSIENQKRGSSAAQGRTVFRIGFPHRLGLGISITERVGGKGSLRALNTGDEAFDGAVTVQAQEAEKALALLTPERRQAILQLMRSDPRTYINDEAINWQRDGEIGDFGELKKVFDVLVDSAIAIFPGRAAIKAVRNAEKSAEARAAHKKG